MADWLLTGRGSQEKSTGFEYIVIDGPNTKFPDSFQRLMKFSQYKLGDVIVMLPTPGKKTIRSVNSTYGDVSSLN